MISEESCEIGFHRNNPHRHFWHFRQLYCLNYTVSSWSYQTYFKIKDAKHKYNYKHILAIRLYIDEQGTFV